MLRALFLGLGGTALIAAGLWRLAQGRHHRLSSSARAILLCLCGLTSIAIAAIEGEPKWILSVGVFSVYSAAGAALGQTIWNVSARRRAGLILISLGTTVGS